MQLRCEGDLRNGYVVKKYKETGFCPHALIHGRYAKEKAHDLSIKYSRSVYFIKNQTPSLKEKKLKTYFHM